MPVSVDIDLPRDVVVHADASVAHGNEDAFLFSSCKHPNGSADMQSQIAQALRLVSFELHAYDDPGLRSLEVGESADAAGTFRCHCVVVPLFLLMRTEGSPIDFLNERNITRLILIYKNKKTMNNGITCR